MRCNKSAVIHFLWRKLLTFLPLAFFCFFGDISQSCSQQNAPPYEKPSSTDSQPVPVRFVADLQILAQRYKVAFVAEGQPQKAHADATPPNLQNSTSLSDAVKQVADFYDFVAGRQGRVFQLTRRYTDPNDIPDVTLEECRQALNAAAQQIAPYNPHFPPENRLGTPMAHVARSLSPQQQEAMAGSGFSAGLLSPIQKAEVWRIALHFFLENQARLIEGRGDSLVSFCKQNPVFLWQDVTGIHAFGHESIDKEKQKTFFVAISHSGSPLVTVNGVPMVTISTTKNGGAVELPDPTAPDPKTSDPPPAVAGTLAQIVADLKHSADSKEVYAVEAAYATKRAIVVGAEYATPADIMNALAVMYGLRVIHPASGVTRLAHPIYATSRDITDLGKAIRSTLPLSLWRALTARLPAKRPMYGTAKNLRMRPLTELDYSTAGQHLREAAIREFRALVEPKVRRTKDQKLPFSALNAREQQLFVLITTANSFAEACWLADRPLPPYIADFDHVLLTGGVYHNAQDEERFSLFFSYPNPRTGLLYKGVGFSNARIPKE